MSDGVYIGGPHDGKVVKDAEHRGHAIFCPIFDNTGEIGSAVYFRVRHDDHIDFVFEPTVSSPWPLPESPPPRTYPPDWFELAVRQLKRWNALRDGSGRIKVRIDDFEGNLVLNELVRQNRFSVESMMSEAVTDKAFAGTIGRIVERASP